jgi:hypothetical protein
MFADAIGGAVKFASYEVMKSLYEDHISARYHIIANFISAAIAMLLSSIFLIPG